ncbi:hypothetical protein V9T40_005600 [Parthenolecanium corni]|uniref:Uncharacterized protein n=1 Tax=Parthenolecanium corni TaxID=536013 RepID=A0AAN9YAM9_9HEMI
MEPLVASKDELTPTKKSRTTKNENSVGTKGSIWHQSKFLVIPMAPVGTDCSLDSTNDYYMAPMAPFGANPIFGGTNGSSANSIFEGTNRSSWG